MESVMPTALDPTEQIAWLKYQIELMRAWVSEKERDPGSQKSDIEELKRHARWLEDRLSNSEAPAD